MPIFAYKCPRCLAEVELQRKIAEMDDPVICSTCEEQVEVTGGESKWPYRMDRVISAPAEHFPGASSWRG